jgi:hypothetical protein
MLFPHFCQAFIKIHSILDDLIGRHLQACFGGFYNLLLFNKLNLENKFSAGKRDKICQKA